MCEIVGIVNFKRNIKEQEKIVDNMLNILDERRVNEVGVYMSHCINLVHKNFFEPQEKQPLKYIIGGTTYIVLYNGEIYNKEELKDILSDKDFEFSTGTDIEVLIKAYVHFGKDILKYLNGVFSFAIWNDSDKELFLARDRFGIKPLYYAIRNGNFIFSSGIKHILKHPDVKAQIDSDGIGELFGVGPAHSPGKTPFKDIFELEPANFLILNPDVLYKKEYWKLNANYHSDDLDTTCEKIRYLIDDSVEKQMKSDTSICTLLSGGLDSSIITTIANQKYREKGERLETFSVDYVDQEKNFVKNDFQPNLDKEYIDLMVNKLKTKHEKIILDTPEIYDRLNQAMISRDFPGMADVDSSYLLLFEKVSKTKKVALSRRMF